MKVFRRVNNSVLFKIESICLMTTLFLISFPRSWSLYPLGAFLSVGLILWIIDPKFLFNSFLKDWYLICPPIIYFLVQLINSFVNSSPIILLENQLMFLLIPIFGYPFFKTHLNRDSIRTLLLSYIAGITFVSLFFILRLFSIILTSGQGDYVDYFRINASDLLSFGFSVYDHPTYLSLKILWIFIIYYHMPEIIRIKRNVMIFILVVLSISIFFLSSKAGLLGWLFINAAFLLYFLKVNSKFGVVKYTLVIGFIICTGYIILNNARVVDYVKYIEKNLKGEKIEWENLDQRTREWYTTVSLIKEKPLFGYGVDSIDDIMVQKYYQYKFVLEAEMRVNAHNQLLESQVTFGVLGTASFLWLLLTPVIFRRKLAFHKLAFYFTLLMVYFLSIESMFYRQWGIMFYMLFYFMLIFSQKSESL